MPKIAHTIRHSSGVYKINLTIPKKLQEAGAYDGKKKIVESLNTKEYKQASLIAPIRIGELKEEFHEKLLELENSGCVEQVATVRPSRKLFAPIMVGGSACSILSSYSPAAYVEKLVRECFIDELGGEEASVEEVITRKTPLERDEILSEMLRDVRHSIEMYGVGCEGEQGVEAVQGKQIFLSIVASERLNVSEEGIARVSSHLDKFRRALLEVAKRSETRILEILEGRAIRQASAWTRAHDLYFAGMNVGGGAGNSVGGGVDTEMLTAEIVEQLKPKVEIVSLKELCDSYLEDQIDKGNRGKSIHAATSATIMVRAVLGDDVAIHTIDQTKVRELIDFHSSLPKNVTVGDDPIAYRNRVESIKDDEYEEQSETTYKNKWILITAIFNHGATEFSQAMPVSPLKSSKVTNYFNKMVPSGAKRGVVEFTVDELNAIFQQPLYTGHAPLSHHSGWKIEGKELDRRSGRYWTPLFMLFHGCRLNEIAQAMPQDVNTESEIPYLRISPYWGLDGEVPTPKMLKNKNSDRLLPLHPEIIKCGFLEFVEERKREGAIWLFPEWVHASIRDWKVGQPLPEVAGRHSYLASDHCLKLYATVIDEDRKPRPNNHSFRHGVMTVFHSLDVPTRKAEQILGWDDQKESMTKHYGSKLLTTLLPEVQKVQFEGLDISHLYLPNR